MYSYNRVLNPDLLESQLYMWYSKHNIRYISIQKKGPTVQDNVSITVYQIQFKNKKGGDDLLSHWATPAVPSAPRDFTSVFGMGTGVALWLSSPPNKMVFE